MLLHAYYPDDPRAAVQARAAGDAGFDVDVVALRRPGQAATEVVDGVGVRRLPVERHRGGGLVTVFGEYVGFTARAALAAASLARRRRYDVVQVHNPPDFLVLAALGPRLFGARIVFDVHDLASDLFAMRFGGKPGARLAEIVLRFIERTAARSAAAVLTVHEPYRQELAARGVNPQKITVVMNSVDERLLPTTPPRVREVGDRFIAVYHGTVTPEYGVGLLVEALGILHERFPDVRVEIYGEGDAIAGLRARAIELGVGDALYVSDRYLPRAEVLAAVQSAAVGVVPNLPTRLNRFALSTKLLEYVALGVPAVSSDLPTIAAHFSDDEVLFYRAGNARALADAIALVHTDPEAAARRAHAARARYEEYRWTRNAEAYVNVLRCVAGLPAAHANRGGA
jgi:glycosyltransferase involved in cell wall biosynthesis